MKPKYVKISAQTTMKLMVLGPLNYLLLTVTLIGAVSCCPTMFLFKSDVIAAVYI